MIYFGGLYGIKFNEDEETRASGAAKTGAQEKESQEQDQKKLVQIIQDFKTRGTPMVHHLQGPGQIADFAISKLIF